MKKDTLKLTYIGMLGAVLTIIGDFLLMGVSSDVSGGGLFDKYLDIASKISYTRIGLAGFFGYLGIPLTAIGFLALHQLTKDKESRLAKVYKWSMLVCFAALGGGVHIICCYLLAGMKMNIDSGAADVVSAVIQQQAGFLVPTCIVFFAVYFVACISMLVIIAKGKTMLPKWMWVMNPLVMKIVINALGKLGTSAFLNGLACSNMSLGALIILLAWVVEIKKHLGNKVRQ